MTRYVQKTVAGWHEYKLFLAYRLHFNSPSYNIVEANGAIKASPQTFKSKPDNWKFARLGREWPNRGELAGFLVSAFLFNPEYWVGDLHNNSKLMQFHVERRKRLENLETTFKKDVQFISELFTSKGWDKSKLCSFEGAYPYYIKLFLQDDITMETAVILEDIFGMANRVKDDIAFPEIRLNLQKYRPFIHADKRTYAVLLQDVMTNTKNKN